MKKCLTVVLLTLCMSTLTVIITVYRNDRFQLNRVTCLQCPNSTQALRTSRQYLWCINHYGPNNQLRDFVKCCVLARLANYTIILPPLFPHYGRRKTPRIQWFDQFYDIDQLSQAVDLITIDQFIARTKRNATEVSVDCYIREIDKVADRAWYAMNTFVSMQRHFKVKIGFHRHLNLSGQLSTNEIANKLRDCSSVFLHVHYTTFEQFFFSPNEHVRSIFQHLHRTPLIQRMASELITLLSDLVTKKSSSKTKFTTLAVVHMRLGDYTVMSVSAYIQQILHVIKNGMRFTHLHIMSPHLNSSHVKQLNAQLPVPFTTSRHLLNHTRFVLDDFLFDVLEQEIAYQAPIFLASPWTTYSATVVMQKVLQDRGSVYVLSKTQGRRPVLITKKTVRYF